MTDLMMGGRSKWEVFWVARKEGRSVIVAKDFDNDLTGAMALYMKAKSAEKPFATLRCKNVAFPPPKKYQKYIEIERKKVRRKGKIYIKKIQMEVDPMVIANHRGAVWCPYCREFRKFRKQDGLRFEGIYVPKPGYYCICGIDSENGMVRMYNPNPPRVVQRTRRSNGAKRRGSRRR